MEKVVNKHVQRKIRELVLMNGPEGVYKMVLDGTLKNFPRGFWSMPENYDYARDCVRYLIEQRLKWSRKKVCEGYNSELLKKHKLNGMLNRVFGCRLYHSLDNAYPNKFKPWELKMTPISFWNENTGKEAIRWLIEEKLKWSREQVCKGYGSKLLKEYGLTSMVETVFHSRYKALEKAYPGEFKIWEIEQLGFTKWDIESGKEATKWLIEERLKWNREQICERLETRVFAENGLMSMLSILYGSNCYNALNSVYPGEFKPWELKSVPTGYWNKEEHVIEAIKWLIEDKLKGSMEDKCKSLSQETFKEYGLYGLLKIRFGGSVYKAVDFVYNGKFMS